MINILVYGSLRKGCYNYHGFKKIYGDDFNYTKTIELEIPYQIHSLGYYPGLKRDVLGKINKITFDLLSVSKECFEHLHDMEVGAGYSLTEFLVDEKPIKCWIYDYPINNLVESGDWIQYKEEKKKEAAEKIFKKYDIVFQKLVDG